MPKKALDMRNTSLFSNKNDARLQNELLSIAERKITITINQYFTKVKTLHHEISEIDFTFAILESRMRIALLLLFMVGQFFD